MSFGETRIEDLWLPYFAVSSNLTTAGMVVHETGPAWEANRASCSLPGIAVPVVAGTHLLVDGGIVNNLPGDVMRLKCGGGPVIAVDVSPEEDVGMKEPGFPSQWRLFWNRVLPGQRRIGVPGIIDILMRTTMLASANRTSLVRRSVDLYLRPPIDTFGMLEFERMEELVECGYRYTLEAAAAWKGGRPPPLPPAS
jgi:NTE family protein/lysophospholipid hydrolase